MNWDELKYWNSGEWQVIEEKLDDLQRKRVPFNPIRKNLFAALDAVPFEDVRVMVIGQDPYPSPSMATGVAFSVPGGTKELPPTLKNIFDEYCKDLHYPYPKSGDLTKWCQQGVLLWNAYPTCEANKPGSHRWTEWEYLTKEIVEKLDAKWEGDSVVFLLLGSIARNYQRYITRCPCIVSSHPSALGARYGFIGCRCFTTINSRLCELGLKPINWRLP
jgi:uracil-DNA glycosylase